MRDRRRHIAVSLLSCVLGLSALTATADAGPMFDWLFRHNQSQTLAATAPVPSPYANNGYAVATTGYAAPGYAAPGYAPTNYVAPNYANAGYAPAATTVGYAPQATGSSTAIPVPPPPASVRGQGGGCFSGCCLFGSHKRSAYAATQPTPVAAPALATAPAQQTTACYGGSCGPGWCQQTVVQYVPQIAYRTAYQPVPVTTYRTTTTINPQNGLPRTCTRPCTSYSYQARRVPYTTYRPVYTTVPVSDTLDGTPATPVGYSAGYPGASTPAYAASASNCASCQTGAASGWQTGAPGYTPGNATSLPPGPTTAVPGAYGAPTATPWRRADPGYGYETSGQPPSATGYGAPQASQGYGADPPGATPWGPASSAAPPMSGQEADRRPTLRPEYDDAAYGAYDQTNGAEASTYRDAQQDSQDYLQPVPMPESLRQRATQSNMRIDGANDTTSYYGSPLPTVSDNRRPSQRSTDGSYGATSYPGAGGMFTTPNRSVPTDFDRPRVNVVPPTREELDLRETRKQYHRRAVPDLERARRVPDSMPVYPDDNTARSDATDPARGVRPLHEDEIQPSTRYAAVPIDWSREARQSGRDSSISANPSSETRSHQDGWRPIR